MMLARLTLSAFLGLSAQCAQSIPARPEQIPFKPLAFRMPRARDFKGVLRNGIPVYLAGDPQGAPIVRINVFFRAGAYLDPKGKEGLAALFGGQLREGGTVLMPAEALDRRLDFLAASIHSYCGGTQGNVSIQIMEKDLREGLDYFMQVLTRPAFAQDRLDQAKRAMRERLGSRNDDVTNIGQYQMGFLLRGEGHFSTAVTTPASLDAISREDLLAFHERLLHPGNLIVSVSGKFSNKDMLELLNGSLGSLKPGKASRLSPKVPAPAFQRQPGIYVVDKDVPQSLVRLALPGLRRTDPDWPAAVVMNDLLGGGGFTCRLMKKIRSDEGLTYGISSRFEEGPFWRGDWSCGFKTQNRSVPYALRLAFQEIERFKRDGVTGEELAVTKDSIIQAFPGEWSDRKSLVMSYAMEYLNGWPEDWFADYREKIQAVTREDVLRVARKYLNLNELVILVVGAAEDAERGEPKDHPGTLAEVAPLPLRRLPLREPLTLRP